MNEAIRCDGRPAGQASQDRPIGEIARQLPEQVTRLVREELRLAQLEMRQKGKRASVGAGMLGGGGIVAFYGVAAVLATVVLLLAKVMPAWAGALIVGGGLLAVAAALAGSGRKQVQKAAPPMPQQAAESIKADLGEIKERAQR